LSDLPFLGNLDYFLFAGKTPTSEEKLVIVPNKFKRFAIQCAATADL